MGTKVTLTIPDDIYRQAQEIAELENRPLSDIFNEALSQLFPATHVSPQRAQMEREQSAFRSMHAHLITQYPGEYVAVFQGEVVDHGQNELALVGRIDEAYPDKVVLIKRVRNEGDIDLQMRSPRLVQE